MGLRPSEEGSGASTVGVPGLIVEEREDRCGSILELLNFIAAKVSSIVIPVRIFFGSMENIVVGTTCSHTTTILGLVIEGHSFCVIGDCCCIR